MAGTATITGNYRENCLAGTATITDVKSMDRDDTLTALRGGARLEDLHMPRMSKIIVKNAANANQGRQNWHGRQYHKYLLYNYLTSLERHHKSPLADTFADSGIGAPMDLSGV